MAAFDSYLKPGVTTQESVEDPGALLFGDVRIPVLIGEGQETKAHKNVEMHRGSSSVVDDLVVKENLSDQVTGLTRSFQLGYFPVVKGNGAGTITNLPTDITILADGIPATVTSLNGETGGFQTQAMYAEGTQLEATYYFKRRDTFVQDEDLSNQVPAFAVWEGDANLPLSLSIPGALGNSVRLSLVSTTPTDDSVAVGGIGTDQITIQLLKSNGSTRTYGDIKNLIEVGILTVSGYIVLQGAMSGAVAAQTAAPVAATYFRDGDGPNSNTTFKLAHVPVVDGTNGGVVTTNPAHITVKVNNVPMSVRTLDGETGLFTLASEVTYGSVLTASYYTNTYQDTYDMIPSGDVSSLDMVGFGPDREDFVNTVDYVLENTNGSARIQWGASVSTQAGVWTAGYEPFNGSVITTTLVDEKVFLRPVQGVVDGKNSVFTLLDVPTEGSGLSRPTNDPGLIHVYVGTDPINALSQGEVRVIQCFGQSRTFKLYTPPAAGRSVFASYYRSTLNDHTYTFNVAVPGIIGQGTYTITDELGNVVPVVKPGAHTVTEANFATTGIVWPYSASDLSCVPGKSPNETITVTFEAGDPDFIITPAVQATAVDPENDDITFRSTNTGTAPNGVVKILFVGVTEQADATALEVSGDTVSVYITKVGGVTRTLQEIINLFTTNPGNVTWPTATGTIICEPSSGSAVLTTNAAASSTNPTGTAFANGAAAVTSPRSLHYTVTSNRTQNDSLLDGMGVTTGTGYLNQTFEAASTGVRFTIINPDDALEFGYTSLPSPSYHFQPGDTLVFTVNNAEARVTSAVTTNALAGVRTKVVSTYGMKAGDTAVVTTYNKAGNEPKVGDFYFISYTTVKSDSEFALKLYTNVTDAYAVYGDPTPNNPLSLAARLFAQNGGQMFGCIQVRKEIGLETASDQSYMTAISSLAAPLPGSDRKADVIVPLTSSPVVIQHLNRHLITQGSQRMSGEATGFYGYDIYATPDSMRSLARSLKTDRLTGAAVPVAVLEAQISGKSVEFAVPGPFVAAALAGLSLNPANDVATTLTRQNVVGFTRLVKRFDDPTMDLMAADGLTCLIERDGALQVRHWVTTDNSSPLKREPTSRLIVDYTRKIVRRNLDQFIGRKLLQSAINSVTVVTTSTLKSLVEQEIIEGFKGLQVARDENDPSVLHVKFFVKPIFSLLWIDVSLTVTTKL